MSIQEHLNKIRNAIYGREVRESIAKGIETTYDDAIENGNANMEVKMARGTHPNLRSRLDETTAQLADKASKEEVNYLMGNISDGTPLFADSVGEMTDTTRNYVNTADGYLYAHDGNTFVSTNVLYQSTGIADNSVTAQKISPSNSSVNILKIDDSIKGENWTLKAGVDGKTTLRVTTGANWSRIPYKIPVKTGDVVRFNKARASGYFMGVNDNDEIVQEALTLSSVQPAEVTVLEGTSAFYTNIFDIANNPEPMITINNPMPTEYIEPTIEKTLEWLKLKDKSVTLETISDEVISFFGSGSLTRNPYANSDGVIAGDSIVWNTGENPTGSEVLIGYDSVLKRELSLNSIENIGVSGRPMAVNDKGVGTYETVVNADINWLDKKFFVCNAGTNDFKLNIPIGEIIPFGSSFDTTTYIGAYQAMIEYLLTQNPNLIIVIMTPAQRNHSSYTTESTNSVGHKLIDYVNAGKEIAQKYSGVLVDIYSESGITEYTIDEYTYDGLHLNNNGYEHGGILVVKKMLYG